MIAVTAAGLYRRYGRRWALVDVGFEVPEGELVMVTGRNGSGKSTLLRVLATAIRADRGTVRILGVDVRRERERARKGLALLGHRTHLYEPLTALENLAVAARFLGGDPGRKGLLARLEEVGLADRGDDAVQAFARSASAAWSSRRVASCSPERRRTCRSPRAPTAPGSRREPERSLHRPSQGPPPPVARSRPDRGHLHVRSGDASSLQLRHRPRLGRAAAACRRLPLAGAPPRFHTFPGRELRTRDGRTSSRGSSPSTGERASPLLRQGDCKLDPTGAARKRFGADHGRALRCRDPPRR